MHLFTISKDVVNELHLLGVSCCIFGGMRAVIQRVQSGSVAIAGNTVGAIQKGLVILLGVEDADGARRGTGHREAHHQVVVTVAV